MSTQPATIVQRLWNYCNVLRGSVFKGTAELDIAVCRHEVNDACFH